MDNTNEKGLNTKLINRLFGFAAFIITMIVYSMTVQPNVPFWDCGEFTAASASSTGCSFVLIFWQTCTDSDTFW